MRFFGIVWVRPSAERRPFSRDNGHNSQRRLCAEFIINFTYAFSEMTRPVMIGGRIVHLKQSFTSCLSCKTRKVRAHHNTKHSARRTDSTGSLTLD